MTIHEQYLNTNKTILIQIKDCGFQTFYSLVAPFEDIIEEIKKGFPQKLDSEFYFFNTIDLSVSKKMAEQIKEYFKEYSEKSEVWNYKNNTEGFILFDSIDKDKQYKNSIFIQFSLVPELTEDEKEQYLLDLRKQDIFHEDRRL